MAGPRIRIAISIIQPTCLRRPSVWMRGQKPQVIAFNPKGYKQHDLSTEVPMADVAIKVSDKEMAALNLTRRNICPQWNYIIKPRAVLP